MNVTLRILVFSFIFSSSLFSMHQKFCFTTYDSPEQLIAFNEKALESPVIPWKNSEIIVDTMTIVNLDLELNGKESTCFSSPFYIHKFAQVMTKIYHEGGSKKAIKGIEILMNKEKYSLQDKASIFQHAHFTLVFGWVLEKQ